MPSLMDDADLAAKKPAARGGPSASDLAASGQMIKGIAAVLMLLVAGGVVYWNFFTGPPSVAAETSARDVIDSKTKKVTRDFRIPLGGRFPWKNPSTGENTLYPVERCYWKVWPGGRPGRPNSGGEVKADPTYVLLNEYAGIEGETKCPDCGAPVIGHNPSPPLEMMSKMYEDRAKSGG